MEAKIQKVQSGDTWIEQDGNQVDKARLFPDEIKSEKTSKKLFNLAFKIQEALKDLVAQAEVSTEAVRQAHLKRKSPGKLDDDRSLKGYTFYSFDRDIKIEKVISAPAGFKEEDVALSKEHFAEYLSKFNDDNANVKVLKELVLSAFTTKSGRFDYKKLDQLLSYKDKIADETFQKAAQLLEDAKFNQKPKTYFNISFRNDDGIYEQVNLKLSGVN